MRTADHSAERELLLTVQSTERDRHLRSLHDWLVREDELRGLVRHQVAPPRDGEMGGALEALLVVLGSGVSGAALGHSLATWLKLRGEHVEVTVTSRDGDEVTVDVRRAAHPGSLAEEVERLTFRRDPRAQPDPPARDAEERSGAGPATAGRAGIAVDGPRTEHRDAEGGR